MEQMSIQEILDTIEEHTTLNSPDVSKVIFKNAPSITGFFIRLEDYNELKKKGIFKFVKSQYALLFNTALAAGDNHDRYITLININNVKCITAV